MSGKYRENVANRLFTVRNRYCLKHGIWIQVALCGGFLALFPNPSAMAGFKTHLTVSNLCGVGYGGAAYFLYGVPLPTCVLAGGLCGISGMLPDIDSGPGRPLHESLAFAAAVVPMMIVPRFQQLGMSHESIILTAAIVYVLVRFGMGALLKHFTIHRGMFHSIPAAAMAGELAFLLSSGDDVRIRIFNGVAVVIGFLSHLILDEIYSIEWSHFRIKKSFGTAFKFFGEGLWPNLLTYAQLAILTSALFIDPQSPKAHRLQEGATAVQQTAERLIDQEWQR